MLQGWFIKAQKSGRTPSLGERELAVLDILWRCASPRTAQEVLAAMPESGISLSTIQSTLERLFRKDVLARHKQARAFCYAPKIGRGELISSLLRDISDDIAQGDLAPMVSGFMDFLGLESAQMAVLLGGRKVEEGPSQANDEASDRLPGEASRL